MPKIKGAKRTLEVKIRLTETEWNELQQRKTKSLAGWLRDLGLGAVPIRQADPDLIRHIGVSTEFGPYRAVSTFVCF